MAAPASKGLSKYSEAQRTAVVRRIEAGKISAAAAAAELSVSPAAVYQWVKRFGTQGTKSAPQSTPQSAVAAKSKRSNGASKSIGASNGHHPTLVSPTNAPAPTLRLDGLEAYVNALVDKRFAERLRMMMGGV